MSKTFVLIHGTWHGGWAWNAVVRELSSSGHYPHAPTLAGHGPNTNRAGITHKDCVDSVSAYIRHHELKDIILLGHSFGGSVVQKVAEQLSDCIRSVVFLDALILADDQYVFDNLRLLSTLPPSMGWLRLVLTIQCWYLGQFGVTVLCRTHQNPQHGQSGSN